MKTTLLIAILIFCWRGILISSPESDLASPSQKVRDAAAKILRSSYTAPSRTNWDPIVATITNGMTKSKMLTLLSPFKVTPQELFGSGLTYNESFRLDDAWVLICCFSRPDDILLDKELSARLRYVWVPPPTNFTGIWITYFVNGQKSDEIHFAKGQYQGEFISYRPDGSKSVVQHYDHHHAEGADTGFFPSGRTNYHGIYKADKQVGIWTWYNEDGSVKSTEDHEMKRADPHQ